MLSITGKAAWRNWLREPLSRGLIRLKIKQNFFMAFFSKLQKHSFMKFDFKKFHRQHSASKLAIQLYKSR